MQALDRQIDLDATEELPVLDVSAYEAQLQSAAASEADDSAAHGTAVPLVTGRDADNLLNVEQWIAQKTGELRAMHDALSRGRRDKSEAETRAEQLTQHLTEAAITIRSLEERDRALSATLKTQQAAAKHADEERAAAQLDVAQLRADLSALRAADAHHQAALTETQALLADRSATLATLERAHGDLAAERVRLLSAVASLETRIAEGEAREAEARTAIEAKALAHAQLAATLSGHERALANQNVELASHKALLARYLEQLQTRECYRSIYESNLHELDGELDAAKTRIEVLGSHARALEATVTELSAQLAANRATIAALECAADNQAKLLAERELGLADADRRVTASNATIETLGHDLDAARAEVERLRAAHAEAVDAVASVCAERERARSEDEAHIAATAHERDDARAQLDRVEASLAAALHELGTQRSTIADALERTRGLESQLADHEIQAAATAVELDRSRTALSELSATAASQQALFAEHDRRLAESRSDAHRYLVDRDAQTEVIVALRDEVARLNARLAAPESERRMLEERAAALAHELEASEAKALRLERVNADLRSASQQLSRSLMEREAELQRVTRIASTSSYALGRVQSSIDGLGDLSNATDAATGAAPVGMLTRIDGDQHQRIVLRSRKTIGRDADNDISLKARFVSRRHAAVIPSHGSALVEDLRSTNGVIVNGRRVRCARLTHGDIITLGTANFRYTIEATAEDLAPAAPGPIALRDLQ